MVRRFVGRILKCWKKLRSGLARPSMRREVMPNLRTPSDEMEKLPEMVKDVAVLSVILNMELRQRKDIPSVEKLQLKPEFLGNCKKKTATDRTKAERTDTAQNPQDEAANNFLWTMLEDWFPVEMKSYMEQLSLRHSFVNGDLEILRKDIFDGLCCYEILNSFKMERVAK